MLPPTGAIAWIPLAALVVLFVIAWRDRMSWGKVCLAGLGCYVLALLPALGFVNIYFMRYSLVADHYQYLALLGLVTSGAGIWARRLAWHRCATVGGLLLIGVWGALASQRTLVYADADNEALWRDTLAKNPGTWLAPANLGYALAQRGTADAQREAFYCYRLAYTLTPHNWIVLNRLAWLLATAPVDDVRNGTLAKELATEACRATEFREPHCLSALAAAYAELGDFSAARTWQQRAIEAAPPHHRELFITELTCYESQRPWRTTTAITRAGSQ